MEEPLRTEPFPSELTVEEAARRAKTKEPNIRNAIKRGKFDSRIVLTEGARAEHRIDEESFNEWRRSLDKPIASNERPAQTDQVLRPRWGSRKRITKPAQATLNAATTPP